MLPRIPPTAPKSSTANIPLALYVILAEPTSYIIKPPAPNSPHFPVAQN